VYTDPVEAVVFDLDGTLVDSIADIGESINHSLKTHGYPTHEIDAYHSMVGSGLKRAMEIALPDGVELRAEHVEAMIEYYREHPHDFARPFEGVPELLEAIREEGIPVSVLSNKHHDLSVRIVDTLFPGFPFASVQGLSERFPAKPDPSSLKSLVGRMGKPAQRTLFVGDTEVDHQTALAAGLTPVLVSWGGSRPLEQLRRACEGTLIVSNIGGLYDRIGLH
jgi:phosphoglycolate phosphatase